MQLFLNGDGFRWASLNACSALSALFNINYCYFVLAHGDGLFRALLDAGSTAYALISVDNCRHY